MEKKFGETLKALREKAGVSQNQLGDKTGLTGSYFCMLESGKKPAPSDEVVKKIAAAWAASGSKPCCAAACWA